MSVDSPANLTRTGLVPEGRLEPNAIGVALDTVIGMLVIAIVGIRITARTQVGMALIEYSILIGFAIVGLIAVINHRHGTFPITKDWYSLSGIGGHGSLAAGFLVALFAYTGWDGTIYVNEEVKHRRANPGKAAMMAVAFLAVVYSVTQVGLQGVVSRKNLQANSTDALVYVAQALGGAGWAKVMALALTLSVVATTGVGIVLGARVIYGMANHRVLPPFLGNVNRRFATPVAASLVFGVVLLGLTWAYLLFTSLENTFNDAIAITALLYAAFYIFTALAAVIYYWRRIFSNVMDAVTLGVLPLGAAGFLGWILVKSVQAAPPSQIWTMVAIIGVGIVLMLIARVVLRPQFFHLRRETEGPVR